MLKNYLRTALRHFVKSKLFSAINVAGLAIGLAACILIGLYVAHETSYDKHWSNADRIYRVNTRMDATGNGLPPAFSSTSMALWPALEQFFADEIEYGSRIMTYQYDVRVDGKRFTETVDEVDSGLLHMFDFEVLAGDLEGALEDAKSIALRTDVAARLFAGRDPVGEIVSFVDQQGVQADYRVAAVYRLRDGNTVLDLPAMTRFDMTKYPWMRNWGIISGPTYVELAQGVDIGRLREALAQFTDQNVDISPMMAGPDVKPSDRVAFEFQNIADAYLYAPDRSGGNATVVYAFSAIAILVLLIGCINFTILTTAKATQRAKEVAMRKVIGASRGQLVTQFLGESLLLALIATVFALALVELALPYFESLVGLDLDLSYSDPTAYLVLAGLVGAVGCMSGLYPAFVLSHFRPVATLKANQSSEARSSMNLRGVLVIFQFSVSIALMIATIVIYTQVRYIVDRDPGFGRENILLIGGLLRVDNPLSRTAVDARKETLRQQVMNLGGVKSVALSAHRPGQTFGLSTINMPFTLLGGAGEAQQIAILGTGSGFFDTYGISVIAGRDWSDERDRPSRIFPRRTSEPAAPLSDSSANVVINAGAARRLGFTDAEQAIGRQIRSGPSSYTGAVETLTIVGVVADTQFFSLRRVPRPELYVIAPDFADVLAVRFEGDARVIADEVGALWAAWSPDEPLQTSFVEQSLIGEFDTERAQGRLLVSFALLAIAVACLGLFGSASFTVERRTKEIGVRKVFGAEVPEIVGLLLWQFSRPVMIANLIAWPVALYVLLEWLERFPYRIETWILGPICVAAGGIALAIAGLTVAGSSLHAASANPIHALRYE